MKLNKFISLLLVVILVMGLFVGCNQKSDLDDGQDVTTDVEDKADEKDTEEKDVAKEAVPQILKLANTSDIPSLDPSVATDAVSFQVLANVNEGLYSLTTNDAVEPGVAESYEMSEDGLTYTFNLRQNAVWTNGKPVTAHDFIYSWQRLADPNTGSQYNFMLETASVVNASKIIKGELGIEELGVKAIDDYTLEVKLETPVPYFISVIAFPSFVPLNQEFVEAQGDAFGTTIETTLYNGPFMMETWETEYQYVMVKNSTYWEADRVKLEVIETRIIKDANTRLNMYETGEIHRAALVGEQIEQYDEHPHMIEIPDVVTFYLQLNTNNEVLANINARKAFALAVEKTFIADEIFKNGTIAADYLVPHSLASGPDGKDFRETTGTYMEYDNEMAATYWAKAKEELGMETVELEFLTYDSETSRRVSEYIQGQLHGALDGLTVTIAQHPFKNKLALEDEGDFDFSYSGWGPDYADPMTFLDMWTTDSGHNVVGFSNEDYDTIIDRTKKGDLTTDLATRWTELQRAEKILLEEEVVLVPLFQRGGKSLSDPNLMNMIKHNFGPDYTFKDTYFEE